MNVLLFSFIDNTKVQVFPTAVNDKRKGILPHLFCTVLLLPDHKKLIINELFYVKKHKISANLTNPTRRNLC